MATAHPPILMFGAVLAFQTYTYATGATFPFLGFYIVAIPLTAILALLAVPDGVFVTPTRRGRYAPAPATTPSTRPTRIGYAAVALAFAIGLPVTAWGMSLPTYAPQEYALGAVLHPDPAGVSPARPSSAGSRRPFPPSVRSPPTSTASAFRRVR
jgi:hypothetical protein